MRTLYQKGKPMLDLTDFTKSTGPAKSLQIDDWIVIAGVLCRIITIRPFPEAGCREFGVIDMAKIPSGYWKPFARFTLSDDSNVEFYNQK